MRVQQSSGTGLLQLASLRQTVSDRCAYTTNVITYMDAISAIDVVIASVPRTDTMNPYTTDAGPPFKYAPANSALVASQVQRVHADIPRRAQKFHSRYLLRISRLDNKPIKGFVYTFNTSFFPAASKAAASELYGVIMSDQIHATSIIF